MRCNGSHSDSDNYPRWVAVEEDVQQPLGAQVDGLRALGCDELALRELEDVPRAVDDAQVPVREHFTHITGVQPAVLIDESCAGLLVSEIALDAALTYQFWSFIEMVVLSRVRTLLQTIRLQYCIVNYICC